MTRFLVVGLLPLLALQAGTLRAGQVVCSSPLFEAGEVRSGAPLAHTFKLTNKGGSAVEVSEVKPSCGCLQPKIDRRRLEPGQSAALTVEVNTLTQPEGPTTWRTVVRFKGGGKEHEVPVFVTAIVLSEVTVRPATLVVYTDTAIGHELTLLDRRPQPLSVKAALTTCPHVKARVSEPARRDGVWRWTVALEVQADCPEGRHEAMLHLHTGDRDYPELKLPFTVVKRSPRRISAIPSAVSLLGTDGQALPARVVLLGCSDEQPVLVEGVEADHPAIRCTWAAGPGPRATLRVQVDRARISGDSLQGSVQVRLSKPVPQTVLIPVRCTLR
jgi:hypothetical protein